MRRKRLRCIRSCVLVAGRVRTSVRLGSKKQPRFLVPYRPLAVAICAPQGRALAPTYLDSGARYCSPTGLPVFAGTSIYSASHAPGLGLTHTQELLSYLTRELLSWSDPMFPPLHQSAMKGDVEMLRRLLESGESPDTVDDQGVLGRTPLHFLCQEFCNTENHAACLKLLRDAGANLEAKDELGFTPLHCAVMNGSVRLVSLLLQSGVHLDVVSKHSYAEVCMGSSSLRFITEQNITQPHTEDKHATRIWVEIESGTLH